MHNDHALSTRGLKTFFKILLASEEVGLGPVAKPLPLLSTQY